MLGISLFHFNHLDLSQIQWNIVLFSVLPENIGHCFIV